jgi:hypothetical protein
MKIETIGTAPSGHNIINFRVGANELEILRGLLTVSLQHTPETTETAKTVQRMRAMLRCINSAPVAQWIEHGDSTSTVAGSNPAGGTIECKVKSIYKDAQVIMSSKQYEGYDFAIKTVLKILSETPSSGIAAESEL